MPSANETYRLAIESVRHAVETHQSAAKAVARAVSIVRLPSDVRSRVLGALRRSEAEIGKALQALPEVSTTREETTR